MLSRATHDGGQLYSLIEVSEIGMDKDSLKDTKKKSFLVKTWERCQSICANKTKAPPSKESTKGSQVKAKQRVAPEGCFTVYVGQGKQRFVIQTSFANHPLFQMLLEDAESEYGYNSQGPILLPCEVDLFYKVLAQMESEQQTKIRPRRCSLSQAYSPFRSLLSPSRRSNCNLDAATCRYSLLSPSRSLIKMN
ncbi:Small auxin-up RNA [Dillenia turbinata]|uniref:Small auxin-up RNA n=1 Tax=Dillenia turbinata TaxID=194707 RepID=A0AAN8Z4M3_9MAGN